MNKIVLIPGIDSVTFDPFSTAEPFLASAGVFGGKVIKINADRNYNKDDEVYISFGIKSSAECLEDNGLVPVIHILNILILLLLIFNTTMP